MRPQHRALSRRLLLTGGAGVAAGIALAACGDDSGSDDGGGDGGAGDAGFPVTVRHQFGSTTVEEKPSTVVSLGWGDADVLLALGVKPAAILDWFKAWPEGVGPWAKDKLGGDRPEILTGPEINFDQVATIGPDLVTFTKSDNVKETWERLNKLVPTISGPAGTQPYGTGWKEQTTLIAESLAKKDDGAKLISDTEAAFAKAKADNPGFAGKTVCVAAAFSGQYGAYIRQDGRVQFMEAIGFSNSQKIEDLKPTSFFANVSREQAALLDADLTVVFGIGSGNELRNDAILNGIPSAKAGRLLIIDDADLANSFSTNTVLSVPYTLEKFVPLVKKALGL